MNFALIRKGIVNSSDTTTSLSLTILNMFVHGRNWLVMKSSGCQLVGNQIGFFLFNEIYVEYKKNELA